MNKKGQALVEFVIVIPIILMIVFAMIDFGMIIYNKNDLESKLNDVILMINNKESDSVIDDYINTNTIKKTTYKIEVGEYKTLKLFRAYNVITPGLNLIFDNPYKIEVKRVLYEK